MNSPADQYRQLAADAREQAAASSLPQVRQRCLRSAEHLDELVAKLERSAAAKTRNEAAPRRINWLKSASMILTKFDGGPSRHIAESFSVCSQACMERERLSIILQTAPTWVRLGLTVRDAALRERAADALAATIIDRLDQPLELEDRNQLALPL
jgi:hypothetical protein